MKIKLSSLSRTKKIILLGASIGILTTAIVVPVVVLNINQVSDQERINAIKQKIKDKEILIAANVSTSNQSEIESAIKNQLQKENDLLTDSDLSKISTSLSTLTFGNKTKVTLTISINSKISTLEINVEKINLLKNSNLLDGKFGKIFQDDFNNLWAMGKNSKLQVLKANISKDGYVNTGWMQNNSSTSDPLLKNSNITNGQGGTIFQDDFKNLWTMGKGTSLQVLKVNSSKDGYVTTGWTNANNSGLTNGSNITNGEGGVIFQDDFKNLWTMGTGTSLEVLKVNSSKDGYVTTGWTSAKNSGLTNGSNITDGTTGTIFQDQFKNLWTMGKGTSLQVLEANSSKDGYATTGWTSANNSGLTNGSNITNGFLGTIFQDQFKNLWAMGNRTSLQVLEANSSKDDYVTSGWTNANNSGLTNGSKITNGKYGKIFQDEFKNLWAIGIETSLQVLKTNSSKDDYVTSGWTNANNSGLTNGSNITDGTTGTIFQDEFKNLWTMTAETSLQVLKVNSQKNGYVTTGWTSANNSGLTNGSNITNGDGAIIFQDKFKNLWATGFGTSLQVLKANLAKDGYVDSWQKPGN